MLIDKEDFEKIYDWRQSQASSMGGACFKLAGLILSPLLATVFDGSADIEPWTLSAYALGALLAAMAGGAWHREARRLQLEYAAQVEVVADTERPGVVTW